MGKKKLAVFASGSGTNFEAIAQACADGRLDAEVALMVCDQPGAAVVARAERFGVPAFVASPKEMGGKAAFVAANLTDKAVSFPVKGLSPNADKPLLAENGNVSADGAVSLGPWGFVVVAVK